MKVYQIYNRKKKLVGLKKWNKFNHIKNLKRKKNKILISWMILNVSGTNMRICLIIKNKMI